MLSYDEIQSYTGVYISKYDKRNNESTRLSETAIHHAAKRGDAEQLKREHALAPELIDAATVPMQKTAMHYAAESGHAHIIELLHQLGSESLDRVDVNGWTPVHYAASADFLSVLKMLFKLNTRALRIRDVRGFLAVQIAAGHQSPSALNLLCSMGRDLVDAASPRFESYDTYGGFDSVVVVHKHGTEMYFEPNCFLITEFDVKRRHAGISWRSRRLYFSRSLTEVLFFTLNDSAEFYNKNDAVHRHH